MGTVSATVQPYEPDLADYLFDAWYQAGTSVNQVVKEVKELPAEAWQGVKDVAASAVGVVDSGYGWLQGQVFIWVGAALLVIILLAKSGAVPQVANLVKALYGG